MSSPAFSLKKLHTFAIETGAEKIVYAESPQAILAAWRECHQRNLPFLLLGEGSNVLFLQAFSGIVVINRIKGITITESDDSWHLQVGAGENWHSLVTYTLQQNITGLENLALIPGCVGSAPIQNIGAYGVELKDVCEWVDVLELESGQVNRLTATECQFGYRDSIFKHRLQHGYAIISIGFSLPKRWQPVMSYGDLAKIDPATVTPRQIFDAVCHMRRSKLPDPAVTGNAGSFFKNPVINAEQAASLLATFPHAPHYLQSNGGIKLAAGWLIDQCQLKGYRIGGAAVHQQQALVLINAEEASAEDVVALAREIRQRVGKKFNVWLEPEVRFIGANGEKNAVEVIS
ncbi:UDP-N-acetylenolpyruvoylglucosamine reductase [Mixta theicola]|uniref:UDP-N-acetylenolpyruvoylglucosamine reductase n=1 Tax=Mixta theicola TaxID=1458355 RepID=A0A2K1Q4N1_9GAMM|nr:UDP-N-acetylmuramate dehydrogenase [Mixta theicola]PNS09917.1 UDP-N-acetylenolpyruvoylglucosamine reductase [Mixta theicola]GLR09035.1 UDP-N-acetylenolpyruvoylglucosamine reductase [Mixta theicola]